MASTKLRVVLGGEQSPRRPAPEKAGTADDDEELPPLPKGGMVLDDTIVERDASLTNEEILELIGLPIRR